MPTLKEFGIALFGFVVLDGLWLGVAMAGFYRAHLMPIARTSGGALAPIWPVAALVYPLLALGITVFVTPRVASPAAAAVLGAMFGAVVYGVYDLTNHATLREWPAILTVVDVAWGTFACATVAYLVSAVSAVWR